MRSRARGTQAANSTVTIPVQATAVGTVAANSFAGWTHGPLTIFNSTGFGVTAKYLGQNTDTTPGLQSTAVSRDQEVTFCASLGFVYLRVADGYALRFETNMNTGGGWAVRYVSIGSSGSGSDTQIFSFSEGTPAGLNTSDTDGDTYTFGVEGFDIYVNWNGVEQWRTKQYRHLKAGSVSLRTVGGNNTGFRNVSALFKRSAALHSDINGKIFDVRDFGIRAVATTGSISAASDQLTVASAAGFEVGDYIVVETGGEAGAGAVGTIGVGGQWPTLTYANATAMNADTSQINGKVCALLDTQFTYQFSTATNTWSRYLLSSPIHHKLLPLALLAQITDITGNVLTLDQSATASTTNANVYINCEPRYNQYLGDATTFAKPTDVTISWPSGSFAWAVKAINPGNRDVYLPSGWGWSGSGMTGADKTTIFSPGGSYSLAISCVAPDGSGTVVFQDLELVGKGHYTVAILTSFSGTTEEYIGTPSNLLMTGMDNSTIRRVRSVNAYGAAIAFSYSTGCTISDFDVYHETGHRSYVGWQVQVADCTDCIIENGTITAGKITKGLESFRSNGTIIRDITTTNILVAMNSNNDFLMEGLDCTIEGDSDNLEVASLYQEPFVNFNSNIDNSSGSEASGGGILRDFRFRQLAAINASGDVLPTLVFSGTVRNVQVQGDYPAKPVTQPAGLIEFPNYTRDVWGVRGIANDACTNIDVSGVRVVGTSISGDVVRNLGTGSSVINCVADSIDSTLEANNITNAAYNALP